MRIFRTLVRKPLCLKILHSDFELMGRVRTREVLVLDVIRRKRSLLCTVNQVTFTHEQTILILDLVPKHGDLKSGFRNPGTLYLVSSNKLS